MPTADTVYRGGTIHTLNPTVPTTDAVAVFAGEIIALGAQACEDAVDSAATEVVDLAGRTMVPGFHDAHVHPVLGGLNLGQCNLDDIHGRRAYLDRIAKYASANPEAEWILGSGWYGDAFDGGFPHRRELDSVVDDRPASFGSHDGHGTWVNSRALELAGITRDTPRP